MLSGLATTGIAASLAQVAGRRVVHRLEGRRPERQHTMTSDRLHGNWLRPRRLSVRGIELPAALLTLASAVRVGGTTLVGWVGGKARRQRIGATATGPMDRQLATMRADS